MAEATYEAAGLVDVTVTTVPSPVHLSSAAECVRFEYESFGALHQMLSGVDEEARAGAWHLRDEDRQSDEAPRC